MAEPILNGPGEISKTPTGVQGLDEVLSGGLPQGRTTLICGGPGCGKTLLAAEFLVHGAEVFNEPGVFMAFEETEAELEQNVASLGMDLKNLISEKRIFVDYVHIDRSEIEETGQYDLEGLFIRLRSAIDAVGAKRVVLDTIEVIFAGFSNESILRSELRRLFRWLKDNHVTAIVTGERGEKTLTRYGLEEYVSDCVILLDHRVQNKIATRLLRVVKYRGSSHGVDEYPFLIGDDGIWVQPITSLGLDYTVNHEYTSTGIQQFDALFQNQGIYRGSSVLLSGMAGTGKTSLGASMVDAACRRGERCVYFAFEESPSQIIRNMASIGLDLQQWVDAGLLRFRAVRPTFHGIEMHLLSMMRVVQEHQPDLVVVDPLNNLTYIASPIEVKSMLMRLIDFFKRNHITTLFTLLFRSPGHDEEDLAGVSSLMDIWISLTNLESDSEHNRGLFILKARGQSHSKQIREFVFTSSGIRILDVYRGRHGVLVGTARERQMEDDTHTI